MRQLAKTADATMFLGLGIFGRAGAPVGPETSGCIAGPGAGGPEIALPFL